MVYTIYQITNIINNKKYIGKHATNNLNDRYLGSGNLILKAIKKYGREKFKKEILFIFDNEKEMIDKEIELVNEDMINSDSYYNITFGGNGFLSKEKHPYFKKHLSKKTRIKMSIARQGEKNPFFGKKHSKEDIIKMINSHLGVSHSEERKIKKSIASKGNKNPFFGKHHSLESRQKMSLAHKASV